MPSNSSDSSRTIGWRLLWLMIGAIVTYAFSLVLALNKPNSLRGARVTEAYFDVKENDTLLDFAIVGLVAMVIGVVMLFRRRIGLAWDFIIGQWLALFTAVIIILVR